MKLTYTADIPCECGEADLNIESGFVGFMGDRPCSEGYGECIKCKKRINNKEIDERFISGKEPGDGDK